MNRRGLLGGLFSLPLLRATGVTDEWPRQTTPGLARFIGTLSPAGRVNLNGDVFPADLLPPPLDLRHETAWSGIAKTGVAECPGVGVWLLDPAGVFDGQS